MAKLGRLNSEQQQMYVTAVNSAVFNNILYQPEFRQPGQPMISPVLQALYPIPVPDDLKSEMTTLGVDKYWRLYINFDYFGSLNDNERTFVLQHEAWHVLFGHHSEDLTLLNPMRVNVAGDLQINSMLGKYHTPEGLMTPERFKLEDNQGFWYYFENLPTDKDKQPKQGDGDGEGGEGGQPGKGQPGTCSGGSGAGRAQGWEEKLGAGAPKKEKHEQEQARREVAQRVRDAQDGGKMSGFGSSELARWASEILAPKVNWRSELNAVIGLFARLKGHGPRATFSRMNRRRGPGYLGDKEIVGKRLVSPAMRRPQPTIAFALDTSGSMSENDLAAGVTELKSVIEHAGEVTFFSVDAMITDTQKLRNISAANLTGGGGTDMGEAIRWVNDNYHDILIIATDGYTPWEETPPANTLVIACIIGHSHAETAKLCAEAPDYIRAIPVVLDSKH